MAANPKDARLRELQFLAKVERAGNLEIASTQDLDDADRGMLVWLIYKQYVNGVGGPPWVSETHDLPAWETLDPQKNIIWQQIEHQRWYWMNRVQGGRDVSLRMTHKGRVRLSELEQALQTGRDREPFGVLLGQRHVETDLAIAITRATAHSPLSVAYLDANGFKAINDTISHAAGDEALKRYMSVVSMLTQRLGEAYRAGGDEVVLILPNTMTDLALNAMRAVAAQLHREKMPGDLPLSLSCGIVTTAHATLDPGEFLKKADEEQKRAKARSRVDPPRPSVVAVQGQELEVIPWR